MKKKLTIALVAHDNRKVDMIDWAVFNADFLAAHNLVCTGTTGTLIRDAFERRGIEYSNIRCMHSGPMGGDTEIAAMVVRKEINLAVFLIDDLNPQPQPTSRCSCASAAFTTYPLRATVTAPT